MLQNLSYAAVVIGNLRVNECCACSIKDIHWSCKKAFIYLERGCFFIVLCKTSVQKSSAKLVHLFGILRVDGSGEQRTLFLPVLAVRGNHHHTG